MHHIITAYVEKPGEEGCGNATITEGECNSAANSLGYKSSNGYEVVNYAHLPHGCFVGHKHTQWTYTYFNSNAGITNAAFKSICKEGKYVARLFLGQPLDNLSYLLRNKCIIEPIVLR